MNFLFGGNTLWPLTNDLPKTISLAPFLTECKLEFVCVCAVSFHISVCFNITSILYNFNIIYYIIYYIISYIYVKATDTIITSYFVAFSQKSIFCHSLSMGDLGVLRYIIKSSASRDTLPLHIRTVSMSNYICSYLQQHLHSSGTKHPSLCFT